MSLCVLEADISKNMKFTDFAGGHFGNDVIQIVHPILVMVSSIFHGERGPMNKIKQVPYCPGGGGGGCTRGLSGPWTKYYKNIFSKFYRKTLRFNLNVN